MKKVTKLVVMSLLTVTLCVSLIAGATFALFTSEANVDIVVSSGKVSVTAAVADVKYASDIEDNYVWQDTTEADGVFTGNFDAGGSVTYTTATNEMVLAEIKPGDAVKFTLSVTNESTVRTKYSVRLDVVSDDGLYDLLNVTANGDKLTGSPAVISSWTELDATDGTATVAATVEVIIALPAGVGNEGMDKSSTLSLKVVAIQANGATCADGGPHSYVDDVCRWCGQRNPYAAAGKHDESGDNYVITGLPDGVTDTLDIPGVINGKNVSIGAQAFKGASLTSVTLGDGVASIGADAFRGCTNLVDVTLGEGLESIGGMAFRGTAIEQIDIPDSVHEIGAYAFCENTQLTDVELPADLETIGSGVFAFCTGLENCDLSKCTNLKKIGTNAFAYTAVTSVTLPASLDELGSGAFSFCSELTSATIEEGVTMINSATFYQCTSLEEVNIPGSVTYIGPMAFEATKITDIVFPDGLTEIGYQAFYNCKNLQSINLPDTVTKIGKMSFCNCENVTSIKLSSSLTIIPQWAFQYCSKVSELVIPDGVKEIGFNAFVGCDALPKITLPASVATIVEGAFIDYHGAIEVDPRNETFEAHDDMLINKVTHTLLWAKSDVTSVAIPADIERIADYAFDDRKSLASIEIPASVKEIGLQAFHGCAALASITLHEGITSIGANAFSESAYYQAGEHWTGGTSENGILYMSADGKDNYYLITAHNVTETAGILDNTVVIADSAFSKSGNITSIEIPVGVVAIGKGAFSSCGNIASVTIPDSVTLVGESAFAKNTEIKFEPSNSRYSVVSQDGWSYVFDGATSTLLWAKLDAECTSITIPDSVKRIGYRAFAGCSGLTDVVISASVTEIAKEAFSGCAALTNVTFKGATYVGENAFGSCKVIKNISFEQDGEGLVFHVDAFAGCTGITRIEFNGSRDRWLEIMKLNDTFVTLSQQITIVYNGGSMVIVSAEIQ